MPALYHKRVIFAAIVVLAWVGPSVAGKRITRADLALPDTASLQILSTVEGTSATGRIVEVAGDSVVFASVYGTNTIPIDRIDKVTTFPRTDLRNGRYWPNPNATRLFFAPTGRMLKKGEAYFSDMWLFFPALTIGVTDRVTVGGGMSIFPGVDPGRQAFYITPKIGIASGARSSLAAGALVVRVPGDNRETVGILYGVGTWGSIHQSITVGAGMGFEGGNLADRPMLMVGGEKRLSKRVALLTENWVFPGVGDPVVSYGIRLFGDRAAFDLGFYNSLGGDALWPGVPYIDFVIQIGR